MKRILAFFMILMLAGCDIAPSSKTGADGYKFGDKQYTQTELKVSVVIYPDKKSFENEIKRRNLKYKDIAAFSVLYVKDQSRCTIHMVDPGVDYSPEFVGHEFLHCVYGQWHTSNDKRG
jgi:hypothetical protein